MSKSETQTLAWRPGLGLALGIAVLGMGALGCAATNEASANPSRPSAAGEWIEVDPGVSLYVERAGKGPTVILIEGAQMDLRQWDEVFAALAQDHDVLRYDVRGFGRSDWAEGPYQHHRDLGALMDDLGIQSAHLVGLSLGGRIAVDFALETPERVRSLVLSGPGASGFTFDGDSFAEISRVKRSSDPERVAEAWLRHGYMAPAMEHRHLAPRLRELALDNAKVWLRIDHEQPLDPPAINRLDQVEQPTLLLLGSRDEPDIHSIALLMEAQMPLLVRRDVADASHLLPMERPEWFARTVAEFIERTGY